MDTRYCATSIFLRRTERDLTFSRRKNHADANGNSINLIDPLRLFDVNDPADLASGFGDAKLKTTACAGIAFLAFAAAGVNGAEEHQSPEVADCRHATLVMPGVGNNYKGAVNNDDYAFSVQIPTGLTGWSGVAREAPFHGFTMFLNSKLSACLVFEIHVRVDEGDKPVIPSSAVPISLGDASAWQTVSQSESTVGGTTNIRATFVFERPDQVDDGEILLVAPTSTLPETKALYDAFVRSLSFHR